MEDSDKTVELGSEGNTEEPLPPAAAAPAAEAAAADQSPSTQTEATSTKSPDGSDAAATDTSNLELQNQIRELRHQLEAKNSELERELERRCNLEQQFTDAAKQATDRIKELVEKSDQDDIRLSELKKKFELFTRETSTMIENFTTNREVLTSQLLELRQENDYLLGKFIGRSRDMQSDVIDLPQTMEELQFLCLTLNEKLILVSSAKEQLEETLMQIK